ncbi:PEP motif putative anchor domain protein [Gemmatirosa kalamazoonensis]|uniref:PEP motif putative anchor domain protein n=1 Tax=Gemmatirosa kalamazoonensis TaxID=861299 RepID=W0RII8_9BACT|nr:PEP-CTERM sorting domain-containing protein [Gemmatirosa kalamazoonensis]AHG90155.1 PEP motif putative anchor domain protein [Gemmatirosa kalamazoonensis]
MALLPRRARVVLPLLAIAIGASSAIAQPRLLVNVNDAGRYVYGGLHYGGQQWATMTSTLNRVFTGGVTTTNTLLDLSQMLTYDALWVDQRFQTTASAAEIDNLKAYAATGRRVVVMGENAAWGGWNQQILGAFGGIEGPLGGYGILDYGSPSGGLTGAGCLYGRNVSVQPNALTQGVSAISLACGGYAIGGVQLFAYNVATLWGSTQNVLTVLDANIFDDLFAGYDAPVFRDRVATWLSASRPTLTTASLRVATLNAAVAPVGAQVVSPEPTTLLLLAGGIVVLSVATRRTRRS